MSQNNFLNKENLTIIWDVISDEETFKFLSRDKQTKIAQVFENNLTNFYNGEKNKSTNLVDMNKKFILMILKYIKETFPQQHGKIKIHEEIPLNKNKELITNEEIKNQRTSQFERDLNARQMEFENAITIKQPPVPEFGDKLEDKPITDMDRILKEMTEKRNYEVLSIANNQTQNQNPDSWLKPQETSIQNEKLQKPQSKENKNVNNNGNRLKYIKIENDEISLTNEPKKNVSWDQNLTTDIQSIENNDIEGINIFNKLKKTEQKDRIQILEDEVKFLNSKIDMILDLLNKK